jgi:predicted permease
METFAADVRYAFRTLRANPAFTAVAVTALALGIGANTAIFTVVNSVLLQPLPYPESNRLMVVCRQFGNEIQSGSSNSIPKYMVWRENHVFDAMTLYGLTATGVTLGAGDRPEQAKAMRSSEGYFHVFGVAPLLGRTFTPGEDLPGGAAVAVISYGLWQTRFGGDPAIVGQSILMDRVPTTVIGVLSKGFLPDPPADVWLPLKADPASTNQGHYLRVAARLKTGVTLGQARAEMKILGERFRAANPKWMDEHETVGVQPLQEAMVGPVKPALIVLLGAVGFVLLIACANVANLLLARAAVRQREIAVRAAIGASRARVIRQLLTESVLLAFTGGALGFVLGSWGVRGLLLVAPGNIPRLTDPNGLRVSIPPLDGRIALFSAAVALFTAIVFGLLPALHTSKPDLAFTLKEAGGRSGSGRAGNRARSILVAAEVALALVLLIGAALMIRTFLSLRSAPFGIDAHNVLTMETSLGSSYSTTARVDNLVTQVVRRLEALPGVEAAGAALALPSTIGIDMPFNITGKPPAKGETYNGDEQWRFVSPHYFQAFHIPVLRGRAFRESDVSNSQRVVIVNQAMAKTYWPNEDPIGQVIVIGRGLGPQFEDQPRQVVGIVGTVRETGPQGENQSVMYIPQSQSPDGITALANSVLPLSWIVRGTADPDGLRAAIEREFRAVDGLLSPSRERTMEQVLAESTARQNFNMILLSVFAAIALLLAAIGVYGLMSYSVERRTHEMGIRMALGASRGDLLRIVLLQGAKLTGAGVAAGLLLAYGLTRLLASLLFGVKAVDPLSFAGVAAALSLVALAATYLPARRASNVPPSNALRHQ